VTMISPSALESIDLNKYQVLILPGGSYTSVLPEKTLNSVKAWVRRGGHLIAVQRAVSFLEGKEGFSLKRKKKEEKTPDKTPDKEKASSKNKADSSKAAEDAKLLRNYGDRARDGVTDDVPGAIYRVTVDNSHPLGFGFGKESFVLKLGAGVPSYLEGSGTWNVGVLKERAHVSGQVGYKAAKLIDRSLAFGVQNMGSGTIVYLVDDPVFRGFWYSGRLLLGNAVFLVGR